MITKIHYGSLFQVIVFAVGGGFAYGADNSQVLEELASTVPCALVSKPQVDAGSPIDLFSKFDRAGVMGLVEVFAKLNEPEQKDIFIKFM